VSSAHDVHIVSAWVMIVSNAIVGAWALAAQRWTRLRHAALWWITALAEITTVVVAASGALIVSNEGIELEAFHALYGFSTIFAVAILYSYRNSPFISDKLHLLYGCGGLFIAGLGIRALFLDSTSLDSNSSVSALTALFG